MQKRSTFAVSTGPRQHGQRLRGKRPHALGLLSTLAGLMLTSGPLAASASTDVPASPATSASAPAVPSAPASAASATTAASTPQQLLKAGLQAHERGAAAQAQQHFEAALQALAAQNALGTPTHAQVLIGMARAQRVLRKLPQAEAAAAQAHELLLQLGLQQSQDMIDLLNARTLLAYARQDMLETIRLAREEVALYGALGMADSPKVLDAYATLGAVLGQLHRMDESNAMLQQGLALIDRLPPDAGAPPGPQLGILHNLAANYNDVGRMELAIPLAERAIALAGRSYGQGSARQLVGTMLLARAHSLAGRLGQSLRVFEGGLAIADAQRASVSIVQRLRLLHGMSELLIKLGDLEGARDRLNQGLADAAGDAELDYWRGRFLRQLGLLAMARSRWAEADQALAESTTLTARSLGTTPPLLLEIQAERCQAQVRGRLQMSACEPLRQRMEELPPDAGPITRYRVQTALALQAQAQHNGDAALTGHLLALAAARRSGSADPLWQAFDALAQHLRSSGDAALAVFFGKQAISAIEALRSEIGANASATQERSFLVDKTASYRRLAGWLAEDGRIDEALATLRLLKEEEFLDFMQRNAGLVDGRRGELTRTEQSLRQRWQAMESRLPETRTPGDDQAWAEQAREALGDLSRSLRNEPRARPEGQRPQASGRAPAPGSASGPAMKSGPEVKQASGQTAGQLTVYAISTETQLTLVFDSTERRETLQRPVSRAALGRDIGEALASLTGAGNATLTAVARGGDDDVPPKNPAATGATAMQRLWQLIGQPLDRAARQAKARHIQLHLDGVLRYLPLAALSDGKHFLGERYALSHRVAAPTGQAGRPSDDPGASAHMRRLQALGVTREWNGLKPLQGVAQEVCSIVDGPVWGLADGGCDPSLDRRGAWRGEAWLDAQFTANRLAEATERGQRQGAAMLHVGTHFTLRPGNVARSWLLLGDGSRMHLDELARLDFAGHSLVTLSACETGIGGGEAADGREVDGLNMLVVRRGAQAVLASLWRVDDASTSALMRQFYRELARTDAPEALRRAQQQVRRSGDGRWAAPRHWAGFYITER